MSDEEDKPDSEAEDPEFADDVILYRRVPPIHFRVENGVRRVVSAAFSNTTGTRNMSVDIDDLIKESDRDPKSCLDGYEGFGLVSFTVGLCHELEQNVRSSPTTMNEAHGDVVGHKTRSAKKKFARQSSLEIEPSLPSTDTD